MNQLSRTLQFLVWGFLGGVIFFVLIAFTASLQNRTKERPGKPLPVIGPAGSFTLTNQQGRVVTEKDLLGKVWIADVIFTRCPGPCAQMTRRLAAIQKLLQQESRIHLVSVTTDPTYDTPQVLQNYAIKFGADPDKWWFLTGSPSEIRQLATKGLLFTAIEKDPAAQESPMDLFIHSTTFALVDKKGRLRAQFDLEANTPEEIALAAKRLSREK